MPELRPFEGIRYSAAENLRAVVCPPYDVITPEEQERLYARDPHNAVRVELPFSERPGEAATERYRRAARHFRAWLADGVVRADPRPALYVLRQDFVSTSGERRRVIGLIGALTLEPLGGGGVLAHEQTMPGPVEDRLALLRACPVNISPIYAIYQGQGRLQPFLDSLATRPPAARFTDESGTLHRLWVVEASAEVDMLAGDMGRHQLVIADGHHRYETALAYRRERDRGPGPQDAVMCLCVDADCEEIDVLPYHRTFEARLTGAQLERALRETWPTVTVPSGEGIAALQRSGADHPLLFVLPAADVLVEVPAEEVDRRLPDRPLAWRRLDVVALHEVVIPALFPGGLHRLHFSSDASLVASSVRNGGRTGGVILRALAPEQVMAVARAGVRMPQKASYFWPKAPTGLVFRALSDEVLPQS